MCLYNLGKNKKCKIEKIPSNHLLKSLGVREGLTVSIMSKQPLGGPVIIQMGKRSLAIAKDVAEKIHIEEVS
ncbi:MAG: ferrous iron transport protein A [Clostridiales bacterium]|nr:ferrous iron transport protein A [Clostridiales bacterium]